MSEVAVQAEGLRRYFEGGRVKALDDVSITIQAGESVAVVGASGCGKTTLLNLLGLLDRPTAGSLWIAGSKIDADTDLDRLRAREIGFIFQLHNLIPTLSAVENVEMPMRALKVARQERRERAAALLADVGLSDRLHFRSPKLSGGERQRVSVARALANRPTILFGDEPTGSLDSAAGREVVDLLLEIRARRGLTLVLVTHNPEVARRMDRRIELRDGRIVGDASSGAADPTGIPEP